MDTKSVSATSSPVANSGDETGLGNVTPGQAAAILFSHNTKEEETKPVPAVVENIATEESSTTTTTTTEAENAPAETTTEESTPAEDSPTAEGETEAEADSVLSQKSSLDPKLRDKIQRRINEEVAKRKVLEARLTDMDTSIKKLESEKVNPPPAPHVPHRGTTVLAEINDFPSLLKLQEDAKVAMRWAEDHLDNDELGEGVVVGEEVYDRARLKSIVKNARITLEDKVPARQQFLTRRQQLSQRAVSMFPFLTDKTSPDYQMAVQAYRQNPWLEDLPDADFIIGVQVEGLKVLRAREELKSKAAEKPKVKAPVSKPSGDQTVMPTSSSGSRVTVQSGVKAALQAERTRIMKQGTVSANEASAMLLRSEMLRNTR